MDDKVDIGKFKTISFDIFDTLVSRRIYRPSDLFSIVQSEISSMDIFLNHDDIIDRFSEIRIKAESDARNKKSNEKKSEPEVTINEIYDEIKIRYPSASNDLISKLIRVEIESEKKVLYKCPDGEGYFKKAMKSGAKILLISDMYLPSETLRELLTNCGYDTNGIEIISSGEEGFSKHSGELFLKTKERFSINEKTWLHIGDNYNSDIKNAEKHGISTLFANWSEYSHERSFHWKAKDVIGESLCKSLNLKQSHQHYDKNNLAEIGFKVFGPLLLGYISWMTSQLNNKKIEKVLFLARDAHLIHKIYEKYFKQEHIDSEYIYLSRASTYMLGMTDWPMHRIWHLFGGKNKKSIKKILSIVDINASDYLSDIHDVGFPDENYVPQQGEEQKTHWLINKLFEKILLKNTANREIFSSYFKKSCADKKKIALVDIGWMGNIQSVFSRSLGSEWADKDINGFYLATFDGANDNKSLYNNMYGWLTNYGHPKEKQDIILSGGVELLEFAMADNTGSTLGYRKSEAGIVPIRDIIGQSEHHYLKMAKLLQNGILSFFEYVSPLLSSNNYKTFASLVLAEPFFELVNNPSKKQIETFLSITHAEAAGSNAERISIVSKLPIKNRIFQGKMYKNELHKSYWKNGFKVINRKKIYAK